MLVKQLRNVMPEMDLHHYPELAGQEHQLAALKKVLKIAVFWVDLPVVSQEADMIMLSENFCMRSRYLRQVLSDAQKVTVGCVTLGPGITEYIAKRMEAGEYYLAALADSFASHYVEWLTEKWVEQRKQEQVSKGFFPTLRFSPGYGDFALDNQHQIIQLLGIEKEITVTESCLLEPEKSITFILGWCRKPQTQVYPSDMPDIPEIRKNVCPGNGNCRYCTTKACLK